MLLESYELMNRNQSVAPRLKESVDFCCEACLSPNRYSFTKQEAVLYLAGIVQHRVGNLYPSIYDI